MNKVYKVMSTVALAGMILGGAAWSTAQAATQPAKVQAIMPTVYSATQGGITLDVARAQYDGNLVSIELKRSGSGMDGKLVGGKSDKKTGDDVTDRGAIQKIDISINGQSIYEYGGGDLAKRPSLQWEPKGSDAAVIYLTDASWLGGNLEAFPDKFQLTAEVYLEGQNKPYTLSIPIQNTAEKPVVLEPGTTKQSGSVKLTLNKAAFTSESSRVQLIMEGYKEHSEENRDILFEFVDDQGNILERLSGRGTDENNGEGDMYYDFVLDAVAKDVKSITVKPFTPEMKKDGSGQFKIGADGEIVKHAVKGLEMTVELP